MVSTNDLRLLSLIESSHAGDDVFSSVSDHLTPFSTLSTSLEKQDRATTVRALALAKQFIPFLNKSISLLGYKRLFPAKSDKEARESALGLFRVYQLCLDCLDLVSARPHTVHSQRLRMIYCLDTWGFYEDAYTEAFNALEKLRGSNISSRKCRLLLPEVQDRHTELALPVVLAVASIFRAVAMSQQLDDKKYRKVLILLEEVRAWFRLLDAKEHEIWHTEIVRYMEKCAISLVKVADRFNGDLVQSFCNLTVKELYNSALSNDESYKFARKVLYLLFGLKDSKMSMTIDISISVLRSFTCQFEDESNENLMEFFDLVAYFAHKIQAAGDMYFAKVSEKLKEMAAIFLETIPQLNLVLRLYSTGLSIMVCDFKLGESKVKESTDEWKIQALLDDDARWQSLVTLLSMVDSYIGDVGNQTSSSLIGGHKNHNNKTHDRDEKTCWPHYIAALKFLCEPLANLIYSGKRKILLETETSCASAHLTTLHDVFLQFCDGCLLLQRCTSDKGVRKTDNDRAMLIVAIGAFILSLRTQRKLEISARLVEDVIASQWISSQELKYLLK